MNGVLARPSRDGWVHPLIKETAQECAQALYERLAKNNLWYELNPNRAIWVGERWRDLIPAARKSLAGALNSPNLNKDQKDKIADALIKDNELRLGRARTQTKRISKMFH